MKSIFTSISLAAMFASSLAQEITVDLGSAADFALVAVKGVNNAGASGTIIGNVATTGHIVDGFTADAIQGTIDVQNAAADQARADSLAVYNQLHPLQGQEVVSTPDGTIIVTKGQGDDFGNGTTNFTGAVFTPGIYNVLSIFEVITNITLSGAGQFIFTSGSHFRMAPGSEIILTNGADATNIYYAAGDSANISSNAIFQGRLFTDSGIFLGPNATAIGGIYGGGIANISDSSITLLN